LPTTQPVEIPQTIAQPQLAQQTPTINQQPSSQPLENVPLPPVRPRYAGPSIVDFLNTVGADFSYGARKTLAASLGISNYVGSATQNLLLLKILRGF
jgi:hypothetical protein